MALKSRTKITPQFELSSMTDLVFLLLIFFMLITTLIVPNVNALKLTLPSSNTAKPTEGITVSVSINKNLEYFIDGKQVILTTLQSTLQNFLAGKKDPTIILHTDNTVPVENVVKVMDIANKMKVKMVLATYPEK
jgi:biopolymer transport protein ExbD